MKDKEILMRRWKNLDGLCRSFAAQNVSIAYDFFMDILDFNKDDHYEESLRLDAESILHEYIKIEPEMIEFNDSVYTPYLEAREQYY